MKKPKLSLEVDRQVDDNANKRKQVDAHVQAFLKAVLDSARVSLPIAKKTNKEKRDAVTQTDFAEPIFQETLPNHEFLNVGYSTVPAFTIPAEPSFSYNQSVQCVPNRSIYSQEAQQFVSAKDVHQLQHELSGSFPGVAQYYTGTFDHVPAVSESGIAPPNDLRNVITQWMEKYEEWFLTNFGIDIKTVSGSSTAPNCLSLSSPVSLASVTTLTSGTPSGQTLTNSTPGVVVSAAPVSYFVAEGSLYAPDNSHFSPYFSLLPSFYTPAAFGQNAPKFPLSVATAATSSDPVITQLNYPWPFSQQIPNASPLNCVVESHPPFVSPCSVSPNPVLAQMPIVSGVSGSPSFALQKPPSSLGPGGVPPPSFAEFSNELQTSAMLAALSIPISSGRQSTMGQWGPLLRYGTYGRLPSDKELKQLNKSTNITNTDLSSDANSMQSTTGNKMPPPPPTFILLRRQAMICAIQLNCRDLARDLFLREKESKSGISVDYVNELESVVEKSVNIKPVYLFTKLRQLPATEKCHFLPESHNATDHGSVAPSPILGRAFSVEDMYVCDLLIGDVLIAEACATFKRQAQTCVARQAFRILSQSCFVVGSIRMWDAVEYLVLCLSSKADLVPKLPPFLSDPFESLSKKDRFVRPDKPDEGFEVVNPKPADDLWLFLAKLPSTSLDIEFYTDRILAQSAEFSQMTISFEVETDTSTGLFSCSAVLDDMRYSPVSSASVSQARILAARELLLNLKETQPIVAVAANCPDDPGSLWGVPEWVLVDSLMWGKEERDLAVPIEHIGTHCDVPIPDEADTNDGSGSINPYCSSRYLETLLQAYAASALVTPLRLSSTVVPELVWPLVRQLSTNWGLLSQLEVHHFQGQKSLLVCKRAPLPRLKRTLYDQEEYGCFWLFSKGALSADTLKRLFMSDPLINNGVPTAEPDSCDPPLVNTRVSPPDSPSHFFDGPDMYINDPVSRLARRFRATAPKSVFIKADPDSIVTAPTTAPEDCVLVAAELNQPSTAIEILDDLPRTLIPGIDF